VKTICIDRYESTSGGTRSVIHSTDDDSIRLFGIERPWLDNAPFESCIPSGVYVGLPHVSPKFGDCILLIGGTVAANPDVEAARYACLMHVANWADQVQGCVGVGLGQSRTERGPMVTSSRNGMDELLKYVYEPVQIIIRWTVR